MKLAVIGAAGLLGRKLTAAAVAAGHEVYPFDLAAGLETPAGPVQLLDLLDPSAVGRTIRTLAPEWVLNAAAFTAVDTSEAQRDLAWRINVDAVGYLLGACRPTGTRMLAISTDYVFDGRAGPYAEDAPRRPLGFYGGTKAAMEDLVASEEDHHLVVRTMVLYGAETGVRPNFALWLLDNLRRGAPIRVVTDQMGNPTLAADLARMLLVMVAAGGKGLYHAAGADRVSRYDFAVELARVFELDPAPIEPVTTADLDQAADRPLESGFVLDRIRRDFGLLPLGLRDSLKVFREEVARAGM